MEYLTNTSTVACIICGGNFDRQDMCVQLCGHFHCKDCLRLNITMSLATNPFIPAKCCAFIPLSVFVTSGLFTREVLDRYESRFEEWANPQSRMYCWEPSCGAYILLANRRVRVGECSQCGRKTCKTCLAKSHFAPCNRAVLEARAAAEAELHRLSQSQGWQRCPNCRQVIQWTGGCALIMCTCGQGFCYLCGQPCVTKCHQCNPRQSQDLATTLEMTHPTPK
ncbi:hypothetical protein F4802DRAFT_620906 [Xylaria palmicola]|nr:hypothetical protein F4802DRAFT_620906 [Xylaria palmicola]